MNQFDQKHGLGKWHSTDNDQEFSFGFWQYDKFVNGTEYAFDPKGNLSKSDFRNSISVRRQSQLMMTIGLY